MLKTSSLQHKIFTFLLAVLLVSLPFSKGVATVGVVLLAVYSLVRLFFFKKETTVLNLQLLPILLFGSLLVSLLWSHDWQEGLQVLRSELEWLLIPLLGWINRDFIESKKYFYLKLLFTATALAAFLTLFQFFLSPEQLKEITEQLPFLKPYQIKEKALAFGAYSPFHDRLQFSYLLVVALFSGMIVLWEESKRLPIVLGLLIVLATLLALGARGAQVALLASTLLMAILAFFVFLKKRLSRRFPSYARIIPLVGVLLIAGLAVGVPMLAYRYLPPVKIRYDQLRWELGTYQDDTFRNYDYQHFTSLRRLVSWQHHWQVVRSAPVLGTGVGDFMAVITERYEKDTPDFPVNIQNQFLYLWGAAGLSGLLTLVAVLTVPLLLFFQQAKNEQAIAGIGFLVFYGLVFLLDAPLNYQLGATTFLIGYIFLIRAPTH